MLEYNRIALKEWAIVVWALAEGSQVLLLRKGGIAEQDGAFRLAAPEFFLYPTYEHQQEEFLQPQYVPAFRSLAAGASEGQELMLQHYAAVTDVWPAPELARMKRLGDTLVWNDAFLEKRYSYKPESPFSVLLVRTYRLPAPLRLPAAERYAGCRSWVELEEAFPTRGAAPVLAEEEFERRREALRRRLI